MEMSIFTDIEKKVEELKEYRSNISESIKDYSAYIAIGDTKSLESLKNKQIFNQLNRLFSFNLYKKILMNKRIILNWRFVKFFSDQKCLIIGKPSKSFFESNKILPFDEITFYNPRPFKKKHFNPDYLKENSEVISWLYQKLEDANSKETLISLLKHRMTGQINFLKIADYLEYQHPIVQAKPGDVIIDGGCFTGDTLWKFTTSMKNDGIIYCFEPDHKNFKKLCKNIKKESVVCIPVQRGLWNQNDHLAFSNDESASSKILSDKSSVKSDSIEVVSIDNFVKKSNIEKLDILKLDVESADKEAIEGAKATIQKFKPKLMLSIYHQPEDLLAIPQMIEEIQPGYKFFLGHHNYYDTETDLYAIYEE